MAAERGVPRAQNNLGASYSAGLGVPQDYTEALKWYRKAADQGDSNAQHNLGVAYVEGKGVPQSYAEAARWYRIAANQGNFVAQFSLGLLYYEGKGVPQDYVQAYMWVNLGTAPVTPGEQREMRAKVRDEIAAKMTPEQIAEAQRLAREWKPNPAIGVIQR